MKLKITLITVAALSGCAQDVSRTGYWVNELSQSNNVVCDPFGGGTGPSANNGLEAMITYLPPTSSVVPNSSTTMTTATFAPGQTDVQIAPARVILNKIAISTRPWSEGFTDNNGAKLKNNDGADLVEWFSLRVRGRVMANTDAEAGRYQFAILSDDGSIMEIDPSGTGNSFQTIVSNDGYRNNTLGCSTQGIQLAKGQALPIKVNYFQGPRVWLSFSLLWRKLPNANASSLAEAECSMMRADQYFFTPSSSGPVPTAKYNQMLARGWQVIPAANLYLPDSSATNPCAN